MSDSGITDADTGNVQTDISNTEEIAPTDTNTWNINTDGNTSITQTPGVTRGGNLSPRAFDTLIRDITLQPTLQPSESTKRRSDVHSRGGTSVLRFSRGGGSSHYYPTQHNYYNQREDTRVPLYSDRFREVPQETCHTY